MKKISVGVAFLLGAISLNAQIKKDTLKTIEEVQLFGERTKQARGMEVITRMPLKVRDQIQSISIISEKAIAEMGALTITDAAKNIPGVILFSNYGGGAESMSIRGYRGTPTLKNGVLMNSDIRTSSMIADMQGVESMQVIRGSAAITQGIGSALGAAGGVINLVTKTPRFIDQTNVGFRYGSWDMYRPTLDFQRVLDSEGKVAIRFNAAYQNNKSYVDYVKGERIYINPSVAFRPDSKTNIVLEMDYLNDTRTPNRGTVNLSADNANNIYNMPKNKFLGFSSNYAKTESFSYMISANRQISDKLRLRVAYMASDNKNEGQGTGIATVSRRVGNQNVVDNYALRRRSISRSASEDYSKVFQVDLIGQEIKTGIFKHTFQVGFDWKESQIIGHTYGYKNSSGATVTSINVDQIDVTQEVNNILPNNIDVNTLAFMGKTYNAKSPAIGVMAQEVLQIGEYVKLVGGVRYSKFNGDYQKGKKYAWDPSVGIMISPYLKNINIYASYTTNSNLRGNNNPLKDGGTVGTSVTKQWEAGIKSDWFEERLRFNVNLYHMKQGNLSYSVIDAVTNAATGYYELAGDLIRKGVEVDLIGKILPELEVMAGYALLDAKYQNSPAFVNGSTPMMSPKHTANGWLNYTFRDGFLRGLNFGGGIYFVDERPVNDHTQRVVIRNHVNTSTPGVKPFNLNAYTTINAQIGYTYKNASIRVFMNNLTDSVGYSAYYRGGYLNRTDPRNFAVQLNYKF